MALTDIETIVIAILENRSFDHMLGYLSLPGGGGPANLEGLQGDPNWAAAVANTLPGHDPYPPGPVQVSDATVGDPPHDQKSISLQITTPAAARPNMGGFVQSYMKFSPAQPTQPGAVMGYHDQKSVPTFDFFASHYCTCDHWYASLPLGTQANRLMAMAGESRLVDNSGLLLPDQPLVYDWLTNHGVQWCAYQSGNFLPFFSLMAKWLPEMATSLTLSAMGIKGGHFRRYSGFKKEWQAKDFRPSVVFIEPEYSDGPHKDPNDDHPPTGVTKGQALLADLYSILTSNADRWAKTLLSVTYDEHGGFFDHVPPLPIAATIGNQRIATTGVRVPAFLISPHVEPASVFKGVLDHTSILQLIADRFGGGAGFSPVVDHRQTSFDRIARAITASSTTAKQLAKAAKLPPSKTVAAATTQVRAPLPKYATPNAVALDLAARKFVNDHPELAEHPSWKDLRAYVSKVDPAALAATIGSTG
jgi:phospholipase C